jgi:NAD(P)-dependent dehydrogenase (short-subunit alcohol dehydrogenase family)
MSGRAPLTYLITGAASGIGAATAELLAERGDRVVVADIKFGAAEALANSLGPDAIALELDITSESGWEIALDETVARFGTFDVLVNNAGIVETGFATPDHGAQGNVLDSIACTSATNCAATGAESDGSI